MCEMKAAALCEHAFTNLAPSSKTVLRKKCFIILHCLSVGAVGQRISWMAGWLFGEWCLTLKQCMMTYFRLIYIWQNYVIISEMEAWCERVVFNTPSTDCKWWGYARDAWESCGQCDDSLCCWAMKQPLRCGRVNLLPCSVCTHASQWRI